MKRNGRSDTRRSFEQRARFLRRELRAPGFKRWAWPDTSTKGTTNGTEQFAATTISEEQVNALVMQLRHETALSRLTSDEAAKVFDRVVELGYIIARED